MPRLICLLAAAAALAALPAWLGAQPPPARLGASPSFDISKRESGSGALGP